MALSASSVQLQRALSSREFMPDGTMRNRRHEDDAYTGCGGCVLPFALNAGLRPTDCVRVFFPSVRRRCRFVVVVFTRTNDAVAPACDRAGPLGVAVCGPADLLLAITALEILSPSLLKGLSRFLCCCYFHFPSALLFPSRSLSLFSVYHERRAVYCVSVCLLVPVKEKD